MSDIYYHTKYIKYKSKYFKLKNDMNGGAIPFYGTREPIPGEQGKCKQEADPLAKLASKDTSGQWIRDLEGKTGYPLDGCPDPSENYFCGKPDPSLDASCIPKCFSNTDCDANSDCSENRCIPKRTDLVIPPLKIEMTPEEKLNSMKAAFIKSEKDATAKDYALERERTEKEKNRELLIGFNETMETGTRRRGIKTRERQELEDQINNNVATLKRNQDKEKRDLNKTYRQALTAKDNLKKNYLIKVTEELSDIHREERDRLKSQSKKRRMFLKEKQANINERNQSLEEMKKDFDDKINKVENDSQIANDDAQTALVNLNDEYSALLRSGTATEQQLIDKKEAVKKHKKGMKESKREQEDELFAMRTQKDSVVSALKDNQTLEIRREEQLETAFEDILDAEIKLFKDQKKQLDVSGTQAVLRAFDGQVGGYPYYMYGGMGGPGCEDPKCKENLWPPPIPKQDCLNPATGEKWTATDDPPVWASWVKGKQPADTDADPSCNFTPEQIRKANVACSQLQVSQLLCKQNEGVKDEKDKWKKKMEGIELDNDTKEKDAAKKMADIVREAKQDYETLLANKGKREAAAAEANAAASAPQCKVDADCDPEGNRDTNLPPLTDEDKGILDEAKCNSPAYKAASGTDPDAEGYTGEVMGKCKTKAAPEAEPEGESEAEPEGEQTGGKYRSKDYFDINDYLTETEF